jgi:hypothetical protein
MRESARYHFPMPWSPLAGTHLSRPSSPKSSPAPRPRVVADENPIAEPPTHRFLLTTVPPPMCPHLGPVPSPLVQHGVLSTLSLAPCLASRCAARMPVPTARRRGPRAARFAGRAASAKSAPSRLGHSLPFTRLHSVRWQAYVCRVATLCPPLVQLTRANGVRTNASTSPPCQATATALLPLRLAARASTLIVLPP